MITKDDIQEIHPKVIELVQPGKSILVKLSNGSNQRQHVRAIVDDGIVIYRVWSKTRQIWNYYVMNLWQFHFMYIEGRLKK